MSKSNRIHQKRGRSYIFDVDPTNIEGFVKTPNSFMAFLSLSKNEEFTEFEFLMYILFKCSLNTEGSVFKIGSNQIVVPPNNAVLSNSHLIEKSKWSKGRVSHFLDKVLSLNILEKTTKKLGKIPYALYSVSPLTSPLTKVFNVTDNQPVNHPTEPAEQGSSQGHIIDNKKSNKKRKVKTSQIDLNENFELFTDKDLISQVWADWLDYKKTQYRFSYKSLKSQQTAINGLFKKSNGCSQTAKRIVESSIENGYKGLFELKDKDQSKVVAEKIKANQDFSREDEIKNFIDIYPPHTYEIETLKKFLKHPIYPSVEAKKFYYNEFARLKGKTKVPNDLRGAYDAIKKLYYDFLVKAEKSSEKR